VVGRESQGGIQGRDRDLVGAGDGAQEDKGNLGSDKWGLSGSVGGGGVTSLNGQANA